MKKQHLVNNLILTFCTLFVSALTFAQDEGLDVDVQIGEDAKMWYQNPLYWVIGALLLIILVAMLTRGGGGNNS